MKENLSPHSTVYRAMDTYLVKVFILFQIIISVVHSQTGDNMKDLHTYLFTTTGYNIDVRPANDQSLPTNVSLDLTITGLLGIDQVVQKMSTVGFLTLKWTDEFLQWTPSSYGGIQNVEVPQGNVWKPDVHLSNGFSDFTELGGQFMFLNVDYTGNITWFPYKVFDTKCNIDTEYFPFDKQTCKIQFVVWSSTIKSVRLFVGTRGLELDDIQSNGEWDIIETSSNAFIDDGYSYVVFNITLKRKPLIYVLDIILPTIFLGLLSIMTFVLPAESGERMSYSVTIFLSFAVFMTILSSSLPDNSEIIPIFSRFLILHLSIDVVIIMVCAIQLRCHHRDKSQPIPKCLQKATIWVDSLKCRARCCCREPNGDAQNDNELKENCKKAQVAMYEDEDAGKSNVTWGDVVSMTDFVLTVILSIILVISTVIVIIQWMSNS